MCDQDQRRAVRVVKRGLQAGKDRAEQRPQAVDATHPVGHHIGPVAGQLGQLHHQLVGHRDFAQIAAHPCGFGDHSGVFSVGLTLAAERARHGVDHVPGHIDYRLLGTKQDCDQHQRHRAGQIDRPPRLIGALVCTSDQLLNCALLVRYLLIPQHLSGLIDRTRMMAGLPDIDSDPHQWPHRHPRSPLIAAQARGQPRRQIPKQRRSASALNQRPERPARRGSQSFSATKTAHEFQLHPAAVGIQGTNPGQLPT